MSGAFLRITITLLLFTSLIFPQESGFIRGKLLEAQTKEDVPFAAIRIKGKAVGLISNQDGGFRIPQKFKELGDILTISCMGYQRREIPIQSLPEESITVIGLQPVQI